MLIKNRMHPKNIYKNPPNFKELAVNYPDFRKHVKQELSGKITINYQDPNAVKELTRTLLKKDFDLSVEINESRLIPRIPLCLNYILWLEDLLESVKLERFPMGVDIGTGCVCIYSLLAARKGWKMLATEVDLLNYKSAKENICRNNLNDEITIKLVSDSNKLLIGVIDEKIQYDFCMCNPPFFSINEKPQNRSSRRPQLGTTASNFTTEISVDGGEISFIKKLIEESIKLKEQIKIYTTLVGKKSDFLVIKKELEKISPNSTAFTEFCQGRTTRWGVAWSFLKINLKKKQRLDLSKKKSKLLQFSFPDSRKLRNIDAIFEDVKKILENLKINFKEEACDLNLMLSFKAYENTWSHQRRQRRLKAKINDNVSSSSDVESYECVNPKKIKLDEESMCKLVDNDKAIIVEGLLSLKNLEASIALEMSWISGDKESLHQIFQYIKNQFNNDI